METIFKSRQQKEIFRPQPSEKSLNAVESSPAEIEVGESKGREYPRSETDSQSTLSASTIISSPRRKRAEDIENILSTDIEGYYAEMSPQRQEKFRQEGEKTVDEINKLLDSVKVNVSKIISLIKRWLTLIPGVNTFFIEQEAKIKTDEILKLNQK